MTEQNTPSFKNVAFTHVVPCFFIGVVLPYLVNILFSRETVMALTDERFSFYDVAFAALNGLVVAGTVYLFHLRYNAHLKKINSRSRRPSTTREILYAVVIGFGSGATLVMLGLHIIGLLPLNLLMLSLLVWHLRVFARRVTEMLVPGNVATWGDVTELLRIYMNMLAGFTLTNATLEALHMLTNTPLPFNFAERGGDVFLNSLYYTVVTMTTLGYGDIVPLTWDAKLLLIFQCLVSYVMFALGVGIITRGVVRSKQEGSNGG